MNIRDFNPMNDRIGLEGLIAYGVDPMLHFAELLRETFDEDYDPDCDAATRAMTARRLFFVDEMTQRMKDMADCIRRVEAERWKNDEKN